MNAATAVPIRFQLGARTLAQLPRRMIRVPVRLEDAIAGASPALPPLGDADGYLVTSLPAAQAPVLRYLTGDLLAFERQRYTRHYADLTIGWAAYEAQLSGATRSAMRRKTKKFATADGGRLDIRRYRTPDDLVSFHRLARSVSQRTYQERLLDMGLPDDPAFMSHMLAAAAADRVRAWLLCLAGDPVAYLYCPADGASLIYEYVGHDPAHNALSPGAVLQWAALEDLFADRFQRFDFTEGEGQHKRSLATGGVACVDLMLLRPTIANRIALTGLAGYDRAIGWAKAGVARAGLDRWAKRLRR